jgi:hypothetical protein
MLEYTLGSATIAQRDECIVALRSKTTPLEHVASKEGTQFNNEVIGSDIENIQLGSYATRSDAKGIQLGVSYYIKVTFFICLA